MAAQADYLDVIGFKMIRAAPWQVPADVQDFATRGECTRLQGGDLVPAQSSEVGMYYWVGRISNAEAFGKGLDAWMSAQSDPNSARRC